jgi:hypothetical protein
MRGWHFVLLFSLLEMYYLRVWNIGSVSGYDVMKGCELC